MKNEEKQMKMMILGIASAVVLSGLSASGAAKESGTAYAKDALMPYVESGELPGAISVFYNNGVQETVCVGYADVAAGRKITMDFRPLKI